MGVPVQIGETLTAGAPAPLFETRFSSATVRGRYRPAPDGQRFLVLDPLGRDAEQPAAVVLNWTSVLQR